MMVTKDALFDFIGQEREGLLGELLRLKLIKKERGSLFYTGPSLLRVSMRLEQAGFDLETSVKSAKTLRKHLGRAAKEIRAVFGPLRAAYEQSQRRVRRRCVLALRPLVSKRFSSFLPKRWRRYWNRTSPRGTTRVTTRKRAKET